MAGADNSQCLSQFLLSCSRVSHTRNNVENLKLASVYIY